MSCAGESYKLKRAAGCSGQPSPSEALRDLWGSWAFNAGAVTVGFMCAATSFLSWSMPTYPAYRCPAWRRPSHTASPESAPWPSRWGTSPPWAALSCTPPVFQKRGEWSHLSFYVVLMQEWQIEPSYHFIVDLVEVDLAHFLHHVFILKCYKAESWRAEGKFVS